MKYNQWKFLYPPRPEKAVPSDLINFFERKGYVGQVKKNGTCTLIGVDPQGKIHSLTRHNAPHKLWNPETSSALRHLTTVKGSWNVFEAEVMHSKVKGIRDTVYLFDILVHQSKQLIGTTWSERMQLLKDMFKPTQSRYDAYELDERLLLSRTIETNLKKYWDDLQAPEDEGLVLKDPRAVLKTCDKIDSNSHWQIKCRRPAANYSY